MAEHTMTLAEVASELQRAPRTLARTWAGLHREHGFPRPLPGLGLVWSRALVTAWIRAAALSCAAPANDQGAVSSHGVDAAALIEAQRRALRNHVRS